MFEIAVEPAMRGDAGDRRGEEDHHLTERAKPVGDDQPAEQRTSILRSAEGKDRGNDQQRDGRPGGERRGATATEGGDHHQGDRAERQDGFGKDRGDIHHSWSEAVANLPAVRCESPAGAAGARRVSRRPTSARIGFIKLSG